MAAATHMLQSELSPDRMDPATNLPLSPTASSNDGLPHGFEELLDHNENSNATSYPHQERVAMRAHSVRSASQPDSRMSTPAPHGAATPHSTPYGLPPQHQQPAYANEYTYQGQLLYDSQDGVYPSLPDEHQPPYTTPASSPSQRSDMLSLRNGAIHGPSNVPRPLASKSRVQKPKRKKARDKADRDKVHLDKPLSESSEEWRQSMTEIEAYINRSAEDRRREIETDRKQPGKIKRPMNSFMLYRKAFQNHTKAYCEHNNHQVVSKVCGASWDQEPDHIRKQFADWAKLERANHQKAHPGYKFTPAKPKNQKRKRDSDDEASDLEMYDWEGGQRVKRGRSQTGTPMPEHDLYMPHQGYYQPPPHYPQHPHQQHMMASSAMMSSYGYNNPNKQMPAPYGSMMGQSGQYLSSNSMANPHYQQRGYAVEDVSYHKTPSPGNPYHQSLQPSLMDAYTPQPHGLEHTPPPPDFIQDGHLDPGMYPVSDSPFDPSNPLHLPENTLESTGLAGLDFSFDDAGVQHAATDMQSQEFGGELSLQDQQAHQLLRGNDESWDIQPLDEEQAGGQYDDWGVDPSLSQPYAHDPSLSEPYTAQD